MRSISRSFILAVGVACVSLTLLTTFATFLAFGGDIVRRQRHHQREYLDERITNLSRRFAALASVHRDAQAALASELTALTPADVDRLYDLHFPRQADGTRRSRPQDFDGHLEADGQRVHGMGAFLSPAEPSVEEKAALVGAFSVVQAFGDGMHSAWDNFYFATPDNKVVMYGPERRDRLMFYRHDAPATLDFHDEEMIRMISPASDPSRSTRCTSLQRLLQDSDAVKRLSTACLTPVYLKGRYVAAFGSSLSLGDFMTDASRSGLEDVTAFLVRPEGDVLSYPGLKTGDTASADAVAAYEKAFGLRNLVSRIVAGGRARGELQTRDGRQIVAFGRIEGPGWYLLLAYPRSAATASALRSSAWILALGLLASLAQTLLILKIARRQVVAPLQRLADSCLAETAPDDAAAALAGRDDEIGVLARALGAERENAQIVQASLEEGVRARTAELERANHEKSRFLANMSHELRTPLNGIIAVSEHLAARQSEPEARELAGLIVSSGRLLERVLSDVLDFASIEAGGVALVEETFDLGDLVERVCRLHEAVARTKTLEITWSVTGRRVFRGDPVRVAQVLSNLVSNAVKFTGGGWITVAAEGGAAGVRVTVTDTGVGFDAEVKAKLFQRFEQGDPAVGRKFGGSGLGLAICRALVDAMGGEIGAVSQPGLGSRFTFSLPLAEADADGDPQPAAAAGEATPLQGARVLLAEDHPTNQKVVSLILSTVDVRLTVVENGQAAVDALEASDFDLVLMDVQMPVMDGLAAVVELRSREQARHRPRTPVLMLTANALAEHIAASQAAGADGHVSKPLRSEELLRSAAAAVAAGPRRADDPKAGRVAA